MPTYKITDPQTGKVLRLTGDSPPTEKEIMQIMESRKSTGDEFSDLDAQAKTGRTEFTTGVKRGLAKVAGGIGQRLGIYSQQEVDAALSAMEAEKKGEGVYGSIGELAGESAPMMLLPGGQTKGLANVATNIATGMGAGFAIPTKTGESATRNATLGGIAGGVLAGGMQMLKKGAEKLAPGLYESAIKIPPSVPYEIRKKAINEGIDSGIAVSEKGLMKNRSMIDSINSEISDVIDMGARSVGQRDLVDMNSVVTRIDSLKDFYRKLPKHSRDEFLGELNTIQQKVAQDGFIGVQDAQKMKQAIYALHRKHYGDLKGLAIEADKAIARGLKEELVALYPELRNLNAKDSSLLNLDEFIERAVSRSRNYDIVRLGDSIISTTGAILGGSAGAATAAISKHILDMPKAKSLLAIALNKAGKSKVAVNPKITSVLVNAAGN